MANGSFKGGTGTAEDPYQIEDLWDLLEMNKTHPQNHYKLVADIDMNDYDDYKFEIPGDLVGSCPQYTSLDGQNYSIRNIIMKDTCKKLFSGADLTLKNLKIENLCFINIPSNTNKQNMITNGGGTGSGKISNIHIGCFFFDSYFSWFGIYDKNPTDCTYNIRGKYKGSIIFQDSNYISTVERFHINFDCFNNTDQVDNIISGYSKGQTIFDSCYITGKIKIYSSYYSNSLYLFYNMDLKNSYINAEIIIPSKVTTIQNYINVNSYSFCDSDKILHDGEEEPSEITFEPVANFAFLDDEQCKDADFLLSQGFPVVKSDT